MIMGRDPAFNILYAQIIEPIEKAFFKLPQVANACDYLECGVKFEKLLGDWFMENDMSKYEASQRWLVLKWEYLLYSLIFPDKTDLIDVLFAYKMRKKGRTASGINFLFWYCRGSGDMDTSLGNGLLNYISTMYFLIKNYCPDCKLRECSRPSCKTFSFVLKGDDSYASIPRTTWYENTYAYFGFEAKINIRKSPEEVEFCSGHFVEYSPGKFTYVQKLRKMLQSILSCINQDALRNGWVQHYYASLGRMYKVLYSKIPIYEDIANMLIRIGGNKGLNVNLIQSYNLQQSFSSEHANIGGINRSLAFVSIAMVNGMDIGELNTIQKWCSTYNLTFAPELSKTCRIKRKSTEVMELDYDSLNLQVTSQKMNKDVKKMHRRLRSYRNNWVSRRTG